MTKNNLGKQAKLKKAGAQELVDPKPGLLLAWRPPKLLCDDRAPIGDELVVGRSKTSTWCITDLMLSRHHFSVALDPESSRTLVRDLGSSNSTFVGGSELTEPIQLEPGGLIRAGDCLFVLVDDLNTLEATRERPNEIVGRFHSWNLLRHLDEAIHANRPTLLESESGSGKTAAVKAFHAMHTAEGRPGRLITLKAGDFHDELDTRTALFGLTGDISMGAQARKGALQAAHGGTLFIDEAESLPPGIQLSLLRFAKEGVLQQLGTCREPRALDVKLLFASHPLEGHAPDEQRLLPDLVEGLHRLTIPPLRNRRADIPSIFDYQIRRQLDPGTASTIVSCLDGYTTERLMLHDYRHANEQELVELVSQLEGLVLDGESPEQALNSGFEQALGPDPRGQ